MTKRLIIAMGLWFLLLLAMMQLFKSEDSLPVESGSTNVQAAETNKQTKTEQNGLLVLQARKTAEILSNRAALVTTGKFEIGLNKIDASVDSLKMLAYREDEKPIDFIEKNVREYPNFRISFSGFETNEPASSAWEYTKRSELEHVFTKAITAGPAKGLVLKKRYLFNPETWDFTLFVSMSNTMAETWSSGYSMVWGSPTEWLADKERRSVYDKVSVASYHQNEDGSELKRIDSFDKYGRAETMAAAFQWVGLEDRYFLLSVIPLTNNRIQAEARLAEVEGGMAPILMMNRPQLRIEAGKAVSDAYKIFLGPKKYSLLTSAEYAKYRLDAILDGFVLTKWLGIAFEQLIFLIHEVISNYAIVIIIVTILIKIVLHPLTNKSFVSMRKMQLIQPKMAALKEQFKSDPKRLNEEMMKLYKKEGVNPMGGCLPMLLQLPIFIALYQVLPRLADIKDVSFLWIRDLSSPDTVATIEAFRNIPLLPYHLNILPLIMTVFSILQTKLTSPTSGRADQMQQQQSKMMMFMPILFLLLFWNMPSGLVLYWTTQTVVSILQQMYINKKYSTTVLAHK